MKFSCGQNKSLEEVPKLWCVFFSTYECSPSFIPKQNRIVHHPIPDSPTTSKLYLERLQSKGLSSVSVHTYFIAISVFFSWLHK
ncbi:MAG: hypothetical protein NZ805_11365 [Armatimonadetes bacterium]|nr:hypothetical protein [Armatimonadota bacterium]MDW8028463.1 hypothetical protein [Armatimonadota bacterium]